MKLFITAVFLLIGTHLTAQTKADDIVGVWVTAGKEPARIQIYRSTEKYFGKIVWLQNPQTNGKPKVDSKNPDESKRDRQIVGLLILQNFKFDKDEWTDGNIYDPESGKTYSCNITLNGSSLKLRGYIGIPAFGRTETWTRYSL